MVRNTGGHMMLGSVYSAVVIDLGGARYLNQEDTRATLRPSRYFGQNDTAAALKQFGTPGYFSPEQIRGTTALSCASDVFSLGVVMLQCLLGRHPTSYDQSALSEGIQASGGKAWSERRLALRVRQNAVSTPYVQAQPCRTQPPFPKPAADEASSF
jgi:serine/threonine protein kinase